MKITPGARITMACPGTVTMFDGLFISMAFKIVFDADGTVWGEASFNYHDQEAG